VIRVKKLSHATYETPDVDQQVDYYTNILGLVLVAKEKNVAYLANANDHHSVILRRGEQPRCTGMAFQLGPDDDLDAFETQTAAHGLRTTRKRDPEPTIAEMVSFEDPKGTVMEVFKQPQAQVQVFGAKGIIPHKLGHVAFHVTDVKKATKFYCDVLGFRVSDWREISSLSFAADLITTRSTWWRRARTSIITRHSSCATGHIFKAPAIF
jgi:catechol 2,3-dioxygenase-like lactoylglutathione lyase family enzyme